MNKLLRLFGKLAIALFIANEVRGLIMAVPVMYGLYQAGGTLMAVWLAFCSLMGIAVSVAVPLIVARRIAGKVTV